MFINKAIIYGNITKEIELKSLPSGGNVTSFSIATNRKWKDKSGVKKEKAEFHNCVAFGKTAELIAQYLAKGKGIYIEGRLQTRMWEKDAVKHYMTEIVIEQMQFGPNTKESTAKPSNSAPVDDIPTIQEEPGLDPADDINVNDIPF